MADDTPSTERSVNLWAPWRMEYIASLADEGGCFLCHYRDQGDRDEQNLVLWRGRRSFAVMNRYPYTGGHTMIAPLAHGEALADVGVETLTEMMALLRDTQRVLEHVVHAEGFNIGMNVGRCAGAGLPGHLHIHIVPRWPGDTNFMTVFGRVRVVPQALEHLHAELRAAAEELCLPELPG